MRTIPVPEGLSGRSWIQVVRLRYHPGDGYDLHDHAFAEAFWIEQGRAIHTVNGVRQELLPGMLTLLRPRDAHSFSAPDGCVMVNVTFRAGVPADLRGRLGGDCQPWPWDDAPLPMQVRLGAAAMERLQASAEELADDQSRLAAEGFLLDALRLTRRAMAPSDLPDWLALAVERYQLPAEMAQGPTALARLCGRSPAHVNRAVRAAFGCTATELANRLRLDTAARRLRMGDSQILDIATGCGFASLAHFYRAFTRRFATTPRAFRRGQQAVGREPDPGYRAGSPVRIDRPHPHAPVT